ncbi:proline-rich protein 2-like [Hippopotamus amphibius kiboko]|uniref:proline-rich protein 2-like n=1 Tax=Hippopotamus amphibius kiboko TaxID=575201 RepID=UPI0025936F7F|nr:proline-rich protein 2-like [Hippopotamus amphibius kiboko]
MASALHDAVLCLQLPDRASRGGLPQPAAPGTRAAAQPAVRLPPRPPARHLPDSREPQRMTVFLPGSTGPGPAPTPGTSAGGRCPLLFLAPGERERSLPRAEHPAGKTLPQRNHDPSPPRGGGEGGRRGAGPPNDPAYAPAWVPNFTSHSPAWHPQHRLSQLCVSPSTVGLLLATALGPVPRGGTRPHTASPLSSVVVTLPKVPRSWPPAASSLQASLGKLRQGGIIAHTFPPPWGPTAPPWGRLYPFRTTGPCVARGCRDHPQHLQLGK